MLYTQHLHLFFYSTLTLVIVGLTAVIIIKARNYLRSKNQLLLQLNEHIEELETLNTRLSNQHNILEQYRFNVTESLNYASRMQKAVMPDNSILDNSLLDHFIINKPRDIVSGDFYFVKNIRNKLVIALGDCTGHGIPGACLSMMGHALLSEIVHRPDAQNAGQILKILNDKIKNLFHSNVNPGEYHDGMDMALCLVDKFENTIQFAGAKLNLLHFKKSDNQSENYELIKIEGNKIPIGNFLVDNVEFTNIEVKLNAGDKFYLSSDGYTSQFGGKKDKKFNTSRFFNVLQCIQKNTLIEQKEILERTLIDWQGDKEQVDDILLMGFKLKSHHEILHNLHQLLISWDNKLYSVGSEIIDYQHKQLVLQINQLYDAYLKQNDAKILGSILEQLEHYIAYHFKTEEGFLNNYKTDKTKAHIAEHCFFTEKVSSFSKQYFNGNINLTYELILFLKDWLLNHIQLCDINSSYIFENAAQPKYIC